MNSTDFTLAGSFRGSRPSLVDAEAAATLSVKATASDTEEIEREQLLDTETSSITS
jgi:hypothetical protein